MELDDIIIRNAIIHILDSQIGMPVFSDTLLDASPDLNDFIRNHIYKIASGDDVKECTFDPAESPVCATLENFDEKNLVRISKDLAGILYEIMVQNVTIPPADFLVATYQYQSDLHLAMLKLNYKDSLVHFTEGNEGQNRNLIVKQRTTLPSPSTRLSEAVLLKLSDRSISLIEKKYEINGEKSNYISEHFLKCHTKLSSKSKLSIVTKAVEQINEKYYENNIDKKMEAKHILQKEFAEEGALKVEKISEQIYGEHPEIKEEFTEKLEKYHIQKEEIRPKSQTTIKKLEKQFLTTDTGIEINIPMEQYNNPNNVEFITNPDGTISVLIKNINHLRTR